MAITNTISTFINSQLPEFVRDDPNSNFGAFLKAYYQWMEQTQGFDIVNQAKQLPSYEDIDRTSDQFIQFFINDFLPHFPNEVALDERKLIKLARQFYQAKGSVDSVQFLFRVLYNKEADIYFPKNNVLRASDGKWTQPQALNLVITQQYQNFDVSQLVGRQGLGSVSNASCTIESATKTIDAGLGIEIIELFVSNLNREFSDLENLNVIYGFDSNNNPLVFSEKIIASLSDIVVDPNNRGLKYRGFVRNAQGAFTYEGDPVVVAGGLSANDTLATPAVAFVGNVTSGSLTGISVNFGGFNYRVTPNTEVTVLNDPSDTTGSGANVSVSSIDTGNSVFVLINTDSLFLKAQTALNVANYGFTNIAGGGNANSLLGGTFAFSNLQFAAITSMNVVSGGSFYTAVPSLAMDVTYYSDYSNQLALIQDFPDLANSIQFVDDLGFIANVTITDGGSGYSNVTDMIVVPSSIGYNGAFSFTTNGTGSITSVTVTNPGEGYFFLPTQLAVANSANTQNAAAGSNAIMTAYGFGQGANVSILVNKIGQVLDIRLASRGFDYVTTPYVSLRVEDLVIVDPHQNLIFQSNTVAFQGANANVASFKANIASYNVFNQTLRLYDYQGSLNANANLITTTGNIAINTACTSFLIVYGNGKAKANAIFLNGLIKFPGFFFNTDGFLSADKFLQDSNTYHNYSYVVVVEQALNSYKKTLMDLVHPAGMSMLGRFVVPDDSTRGIGISEIVEVIPVIGGSVSANAFNANGNLVGSGTTFGANASIGDLIIFNTSDSSRKLQSKLIKNIVNSTFLQMESNTVFTLLGNNYVNLAVGANVIIGDYVFGNVGVSDIVKLNNAGNVTTSIVVSVQAGSINVNTVFATSVSNTVLGVYPSLNTASYEIINNGV